MLISSLVSVRRFFLCTCPRVDEQLHISKMIYTAWVFNWHFSKSVVIIFIYPTTTTTAGEYTTAHPTKHQLENHKTMLVWVGLSSSQKEGTTTRHALSLKKNCSGHKRKWHNCLNTLKSKVGLLVG